ncbi:MAG: hypothetical protein ABL957_11055 [Parvularculaceae bacterium]
MSEEEIARKQRGRRNLAIGLGVAAFVIVVYLVTILRIQANVGAGTP